MGGVVEFEIDLKILVEFGEREQDRTERVWLYFCLLMCFCFSEGEFKGLGSFAGLWAASHFFSSLALFQPTNV